VPRPPLASAVQSCAGQTTAARKVAVKAEPLRCDLDAAAQKGPTVKVQRDVLCELDPAPACQLKEAQARREEARSARFPKAQGPRGRGAGTAGGNPESSPTPRKSWPRRVFHRRSNTCHSPKATAPPPRVPLSARPRRGLKRRPCGHRCPPMPLSPAPKAEIRSPDPHRPPSKALLKVDTAELGEPGLATDRFVHR